MHRNSIHDIKPSSKLRRSKGYESRRLEHENEYEEDKPVKKTKRDEYEYEYAYAGESSSGGGKAIWYVAIFCIISLLFAISFLFAGATATVTPRVGNLEVNELLIATKDPLDSKSLYFESATLSGSESIAVTNTEKKYVEKKATGTVKIFNNHSSASQNLLIDTRLESSDGKIYKTVKAVSIPGQRVVNGQTVPGSIEVDVYADLPGEEFNKDSGDLKIFGFKNGPKYNNFRAEIIKPIQGGFKGDTFALSDEENTKLKNELSQTLKTTLLEKARAELPDGFLIFEDAVILKLDEPEISEQDSSTKLVQNGTLHAFVFKEENLTRSLVKDIVSDFDENKVYIEGINSISVDLMSKEEIDPKSATSINLSIKGSAKVVWEIDEEKIKTEIAGKKEREFESVIGDFKSISSASLSVKPFWRTSIPEKTDQIKVVNTIIKQ